MRIWAYFYTPNVYDGSPMLRAWWSKKPDAETLVAVRNVTRELAEKMITKGTADDNGDTHELCELDEGEC